ncbi:MAG: YkgJ family cysteine cluster protein [Planctomycetes bacterium]|nr:YkgJ family cysteine cluster protein [Planctomycetota bacterium]
MDDAPFDPPECQDCAACCFAPHDQHVRVTGDDHARLLPEEQARLTVWRGNRCFLAMTDGHCAALAAVDGRWGCTIYERRPQLCRDLARGGPACRHEVEARLPDARRRLPLLG